MTISIEDQVVAASHILNAYSNDKAVMTNNSSRFGRFNKLRYVPDGKSKGTILGSSLETYPLEKTRVVVAGAQRAHSGLGEDNVEVLALPWNLRRAC